MRTLKRCEWAANGPEIYIRYHDEEWGVPVFEDERLFEFLILEGFQAGLSWLTILKKRENFRQAFDGFNALKISRYGDKKIEELLLNPGIIRNKQKIHAAVTNARAFLEVQSEFGSFSDYMWRFVDDRPIVNRIRSLKEMPAVSPVSEKMSKDLIQRGFKFVGPTIIYAHMQAVGMVNDHFTDCFRYTELTTTRPRPG
jgi:DNA-3-methyladenine glycosylase I